MGGWKGQRRDGVPPLVQNLSLRFHCPPLIDVDDGIALLPYFITIPHWHVPDPSSSVHTALTSSTRPFTPSICPHPIRRTPNIINAIDDDGIVRRYAPCTSPRFSFLTPRSSHCQPCSHSQRTSVGGSASDCFDIRVAIVRLLFLFLALADNESRLTVDVILQVVRLEFVSKGLSAPALSLSSATCWE